ncbi:hypothetical protein, partial [Lachnoanaerobaculum sp.]
ILNINIFKTCLENNMVDYVIAITESIIKHNKYDYLSQILDKIDLNLEGKYFNILLYNNENLFYKILDQFKSRIERDKYIDKPGEKGWPDFIIMKWFNNILISILISKHADDNKLKLLKKYVEYCKDIEDKYGKIIGIDEYREPVDIIGNIYNLYEKKYNDIERNADLVEEYIEFKKMAGEVNIMKEELNNFVKNIEVLGIEGCENLEELKKFKDNMVLLNGFFGNLD